MADGRGRVIINWAQRRFDGQGAATAASNVHASNEVWDEHEEKTAATAASCRTHQPSSDDDDPIGLGQRLSWRQVPSATGAAVAATNAVAFDVADPGGGGDPIRFDVDDPQVLMTEAAVGACALTSVQSPSSSSSSSVVAATVDADSILGQHTRTAVYDLRWIVTKTIGRLEQSHKDACQRADLPIEWGNLGLTAAQCAKHLVALVQRNAPCTVYVGTTMGPARRWLGDREYDARPEAHADVDADLPPAKRRITAGKHSAWADRMHILAVTRHANACQLEPLLIAVARTAAKAFGCTCANSADDARGMAAAPNFLYAVFGELRTPVERPVHPCLRFS